MRLLEFNLDAGGANPQAKTPPKTRPKPVVRPVKLAKPPVTPPRPAQLYPLNTPETTARARKPIDLEQLQQRIEELERRILARSGATPEQPVSHDLEVLKKRVLRLQQSVHAELWAARQREHTMLQMLSKPSFKTQQIQRLTKFWQEQLPDFGHWLVRCSQGWWKDCQPEWWAAFAKAWQESLDKARGVPRH